MTERRAGYDSEAGVSAVARVPAAAIPVRPAAPAIQFVPTPFAGHTELMGFHRHLVDDRVRTDAFMEAVRRTVRPGDVVIDLGTGTGLYAIEACRAGAVRVYAIDHSDIIHAARRLVAHHGVSDRVVFLQESSYDVRLPELADVLVSECLGVMGVGGTMVPALTELAARSVKPGGRVVPGRISLLLAPLESSVNFAHVNAWTTDGPGGLDLSPLQSLANQNLYHTLVTPEALIAPAALLGSVVPRDGIDDPFDASVRFAPTSARTLHGFVGWFDVELCDGLTFSTSPGDPPTVWQQIYFPLPEAVPVDAGERIEVEYRMTRSRMGLALAFSWATTVRDRHDRPRGSFAQTTDLSVPR